LDSVLERKLVASCRRGDKCGYAALVKAYSGRVFAICLGVLGDRDHAEDVAQQTFLKAFTDINELRDSEQFGAWIGRIARNLCIDFLRRQKCRRKGIRRVQVEPGGSRDYSRLEDAVARLPAKYRIPLMLYYFNGRSTKTLAETLRISEGAVHTRLSRARKRLRKLLDQGDKK
jgi:RNA polymerase sigma-70 factor (ECF subfamily)